MNIFHKTANHSKKLCIALALASLLTIPMMAQATIFGSLTSALIHHEEYKAVDHVIYSHGSYTKQSNPNVPQNSTVSASSPVITDGNTVNVDGGSRYCAYNLPHGIAPSYRNAMYMKDTKLLCSDAMTTLASGITKTGIFSGELLTPQRIAMARTMKRHNTFHPELQLPEAWQAQLSDYVHSGYDRGHMAPSGDMATAEEQYDSFSLANMAPQAPTFNRGSWAHLEESVRDLAQHENLYVITGVLFVGNQIGFLNNRVAIPTEYFKMVYSPSTNEAAVFWGYNQNQTQVVRSTLSEFYNQFGIDFHLGNVGVISLPTGGSRSHYTD